MKVLILGAAGGVGRHLVTHALAAGHQVSALARQPEKVTAKSDRLTVIKGDALDAATLEQACAGQEAVLSALGTLDRGSKVRSQGMALLLPAMKKAGARRLAVISAIGVGDSLQQAQRSSFFFGRIILPLLLKKPFEDMRVMEELVKASGLEWMIVRPTGLTDKPGTGQVKVELELGKTGPEIPRADVAKFIVDFLTSDAQLRKVPAIYA
jgi:uncharacterized protein YbjT (DUF2867 family)